jgi:hypothetical protein
MADRDRRAFGANDGTQVGGLARIVHETGAAPLVGAA